jgi:hypothetical protein
LWPGIWRLGSFAEIKLTTKRFQLGRMVNVPGIELLAAQRRKAACQPWFHHHSRFPAGADLECLVRCSRTWRMRSILRRSSHLQFVQSGTSSRPGSYAGVCLHFLLHESYQTPNCSGLPNQHTIHGSRYAAFPLVGLDFELSTDKLSTPGSQSAHPRPGYPSTSAG